MTEDHGSPVSSAAGRDLKTGPSQGAFKAVSWAHAPREATQVVRKPQSCSSPGSLFSAETI